MPSDRSVTVRARFDVTGIIAGARTGALAVRGFASEVKKASGEQHRAFDAIGTSAVGVGGAMVAGFGMAVKATAEFDREMSKVGAMSGATGKQLAALRDSAIDAGQATAFSATQAAQAQTELAKAGISTADILGGALKGSLDLAAAGGLDLAEAATISAQAMNIFSLKGSDVAHVADVLAAGANKSAADVHQLGEAMRAGGNTSAQFGLSMEETVGVLSAFADNALIGSDAGTSLKSMLLHLANPTSNTRALMDELGISAYDATGKFVGMTNLAGQLQARLGHLTQAQRDQAIAQIFGSDAMRGAAVLYKVGAQGVQEYTRAVNDQGAAGRMAGQMMDNFAGDLEKLKGSMETALIQGGSGATSVLRGLTQAATVVVDTFNALPGPVQGTVTVLTGLTGAVTLLGGSMMIAVPKIAAYKEALATAGPRTQALGRGLSTVGSVLTGPWGLALGAGVAALGVFAVKHAEAEERVKELTGTLDSETGALTQNTRALVTNRLESDGLLKKAQGLGISLSDFTDAALGNEGALRRVNAQLQATASNVVVYGSRAGQGTVATKQLKGDADELSNALLGTNSEIRESVEQWKREHAAMGTAAEGAKGAVGPTSTLGTAVGDLAGETSKLNSELVEAKGNLDKIFNPSIAVYKAATQLKSGYRDLIGQLDEAKGKLDGNSEASLRARGAFAGQLETVRDLYKATLDKTNSDTKASKAIRDQLPVLYALAGGNKETRAQVDRLAEATGNATGATKTSRKAFLATAESMGISQTRARKLWQELAKIKSKDVEIGVNAKGSWSVTRNPGAGSTAREFHGLAIGGPVPNAPLGPGGPTSDDVPIWASVGEHMWTAREVQAAGGHAAMMRMRAAALQGKMRGYATGGAISLSGDRRSDAEVTADVLRPVRAGAAGLVAKIAGVYAEEWKKYVNSGGGVVSAARSQIGLPYSWGGGGTGGPSYGIGRGANIYGFDCSGLTQFAWWRGRGIDIGGVTYSQHPASYAIGSPRPGALGFSSSLGHVVLASNRPGYVIEAPFTGSHVREVRKSMPDWRWPKAAGMATGGEVTAGEHRLAEQAARSSASHEEVARARLLGLAGDPGRLPRYGTGGWVNGPSGTDRVPLMATAGEFVVNDREAAANGPLVEAINAGRVGYTSSGAGFSSISVAFRPGGSAGGSVAEAVEPLKEVAKALRDIVSLRDGLDKMTGSIFGQEKALTSYEAAWDAARASLKENGRRLSMSTARGRENRAALLGLAEAAQDVVVAMRELGKPSSTIVKKMAEQRAEFIRMARAMGLTLAQARKLADRYGLVPSKVKKVLAKESKDAAYNKAAAKYNARIEARAGGGPAGGWTLVGEEGPELTWMPNGSYVVSAARTRAMLAAGTRRALPASGAGRGAGGPMHITLVVGDRTLADLVVDPLRGYVRAHGGNVQAVLGRR